MEMHQASPFFYNISFSSSSSLFQPNPNPLPPAARHLKSPFFSFHISPSPFFLLLLRKCWRKNCRCFPTFSRDFGENKELWWHQQTRRGKKKNKSAAFRQSRNCKEEGKKRETWFSSFFAPESRSVMANHSCRAS